MSINDLKKYTIAEAAKISGLPESTLRYYETIGLIDPIARGITSKQREYTDDNINMIIAVSCLSATGMSIDSMRAYLENRVRGVDAASEQIDLLDRQRTRLLEEAHFLQLRQQYIDIKIGYWKALEAGDERKLAAAKKLAESIASELKLPRETKVKGETV